ncbi:hypothetical protein DEA06_01510 [Microbacterium sp. Gd 4-13]|uniref:hypothetical protein n=1 Tax=Microbacterium sp. Gd 4-13 TaxID=2173179 RepID=UPI000D576FD9|nr:hypothetical protein [Microbacterium sp. Gd 4-13]PVW06247.1 hypothetical protein DEA06_01510 [Microbacterium sp. Gd 4-13]
MIRRRVTALSVAAAAAVLLLAGCAGSADPSGSPTLSASPTATSASPTPTPTPTPPPTPTPTTSTETLPTDCAQLGSAATRAETVGDMTLQSDGAGFIRPAPEGATLALGCDWIVGEGAGVLLLISTAPAANVTAALPGLASEGYTCQAAEDFGAQYCLLPGSGTDTEEAIVARDDVWIYYATVNRNGRALLSEIASGIFG